MNPAALITGGSRGIGRGIALALADMPFNLMINYRSDEVAASQTKTLCDANPRSGRVELCKADIAVAEDRERLLQTMREKFGRIDLLINNAGVAPNQRFDILEATEESFDRLIAINTKGPYFLTQLAARWMIEQTKEHPEWDPPQIVTVSSISAYTASTSRGDYCVSKAGLSMMTKLFAARLAEFGIKVFEIRPGIIATDMTAGVKEKYDVLIEKGLTPIARWGTPEDIGRTVVAIAGGFLPFSTGEVINVDGGFHLRIL